MRRSKVLAASLFAGVVVPASVVAVTWGVVSGAVAVAPLAIATGVVVAGGGYLRWRRLGDEETERAGTELGAPAYEYDADGRPVRLAQAGIGGDSSTSEAGPVEFRATAPVDADAGTVPGRIDVLERSWTGPPGGALAIAIDGGEFDRRFAVRGDEDAARAILTPPVQEALLDLDPVSGVTVAGDRVELVRRMAVLGVVDREGVVGYAEGVAAVAAAVEADREGSETPSAFGGS